MARVAIQTPLLTEQEYLEMERVSPVKHEYVAGRIYAMTGTSDAHNIIALNLATILRNHLRGSPSRVFMAEPFHSVDLEIPIERIYEEARE